MDAAIRWADAACTVTRWQHFPAWNDVMAACWMYDVKSKIRLRESMWIYVKSNPAEFHPDAIWNDWHFGFFEDGRPNDKKKRNRNDRRYAVSSWSKNQTLCNSYHARKTACYLQSTCNCRNVVRGFSGLVNTIQVIRSWAQNEVLIVVFTAIVIKTGHVTKNYPEIFNNSATCTTNLRQICNKSFSRTANPQQIDLLWICCTAKRLIAHNM